MLVFISYAHKDKDTVSEIVGILRASGHDPWFDPDLIVGKDWQEQVSEKIKLCDVLVCTISSEFSASEWCQWEMSQAIKLKKPIIPILIGIDTKIPDELNKLQYVDFTSGITAISVTRLIRGLVDLSSSPRTENVASAAHLMQYATPPVMLGVETSELRSKREEIQQSQHDRVMGYDMPFSETQYFHEIDKMYEKSNMQDWYVSLDGFMEVENGEKTAISVDEYVNDWLLNKTDQHLAILGDYGSGKSWFCLRLAKRLADKYRESPSECALPLLISFRQYKPQMNLVNLIESELLNEYGVKLTNPFSLKQMLQTGKIIPILDGMDEMAKELENRSALVAYSRLGLATEIPKVIVTCRTHYFYSGSEEREILNPSSNSAMLGNTPKFNIVHIKLFDSQKILKCVNLRFDSKKSIQVLDFIRSTYNLPELCSRPVLLSLVCNSYDLVLELRNPLATGDLYEAYTDAWLRRELREGRLALDPEVVKYFFEDLAHDLVLRNSMVLEASQLQEKLSSFLVNVGLSKAQLSDVERQMVTSAFVRRTLADGWEFAHRSFQEFFYARKFFRWERETGGQGDYPVIHIPIWQFIAEMTLTKWNEEKARYWIEPRMDREEDSTLTLTTLRAAASYWLIKRGSTSKRNYPLSGIMLDSVDLHELDLSNCDLSNSDFHNSDLARTNLKGTKLNGSMLAGANLEESALEFTHFEGAQCENVNFSGATIHETSFRNCDLQGACFAGAKITKADFLSANIHFADFRAANFGTPESQNYLATMKQLRQCRGFATAFFNSTGKTL